MTNTKWVLLQFIIFCDKQAQKSSFAHRQTHIHTEQSQAENLFQIFPWARPAPGLFQTLGWTWTRLCDNNFGHRDPQIISGANSKPGLMSDFAGNVHSHRLAPNYRGFGGKVVRALTSNVHPPHSGSQKTIWAWGREWLILHQHLSAFLRLGFACFCSVCPGNSIYPLPSTCFKIINFLCPLPCFSPCWDGAEVSGFWGVWQLLQFRSW